MTYIYTHPAEERILCIHMKNRNVELAADSNYKEYIVPDDFNLDRIVKDENGKDVTLQYGITYDDFITKFNADYSANRVSQYPSIEDQLDMQYWDSVNGTSTWKDAIAKVKSDNPKPSS